MTVFDNASIAFDARQVSVVIDGEDILRCSLPKNAPPMVEHRLYRSGYPTSLIDILNARAFGRLFSNTRIVPCDRDWSTAFARAQSNWWNEFECMSVVDYHTEVSAESRRRRRRRGRPTDFGRFYLGTLSEWRQQVFDGAIRLSDLAKLARASEMATARFVHAETSLWYV